MKELVRATELAQCGHLLRLGARVHADGEHELVQPALGACILAQTVGEGLYIKSSPS